MMTNLDTLKNAVPLSTLVPGQSGTIVRVGGQKQLRHRYIEMGFVRGETIHVERVAPLGDPVEFQIKGYHISLRKSDAEQILISLLDQKFNE